MNYGRTDDEILKWYSDGLRRSNPWLDGKTDTTVHRLLVRALADHADWAGVDLHGGHYDPDNDPGGYFAVSMADIVTELTGDEVRAVCINLASRLASTIEELHVGDYGDDALYAAYQHMNDALLRWDDRLADVMPGPLVVVPKEPRPAPVNWRPA